MSQVATDGTPSQRDPPATVRTGHTLVVYTNALFRNADIY